MTIAPCLFFNGRGEESLHFHEQAVGAQCMQLIHFDESPDVLGMLLPEGCARQVMHASMTIG
ncbi:MAG: hypothetical protein ABIN96_12600 [Rubrivivax sp.]